MIKKYKWGVIGLLSGILLTLIAISRGVSVYKGIWPHVIFLIGASIFFDTIHFITTNESLFYRIWKNKNFFFVPFIAGLSIEIILDVVGVFLFLTWVYPMFNISYGLVLYLLFAPLGLLFLYESYTAVTILLRKGFKIKEKFDIPYIEKKYLARWIGFFGILLFILSLILTFGSNLNKWYIHFFVGFGVLGILEYVGWRRRQETFLSHLLRRDIIPLFSILFLSFTIAYGWEALNVSMGGSWIYTNLPNGAIILSGGVPLIALLQWPFLYLIFLSFYRAIFLPRKEPCLW